MPLELTYADKTSIPEGFDSLYTESAGAFVLTGINGLRTQKDIDNLSGALGKERNDHKAARDALKAWEGLKPDEVRATLARVPELEAAASGKIDDKKMNELVEQRALQVKGPLEAQIKGIAGERDEWKNKAEAYLGEIHRRDLQGAVRDVAASTKAHPTAIADIETAASQMLERVDNNGSITYITKSGIPGVTPGLDIGGWLKEMAKLRPHWWPISAGGGAGGAGGGGPSDPNPWSKANWSITAQGQYIRANGMAKAQEAAKLAGSSVGAVVPPEK